MAKTKRAYGTWPGVITAKALASGLRLQDVQWDTTTNTLVWLEGRGAQGVLAAQQGIEAPRDLSSDLSVRAQVGYGGGDFTVAKGQVYFAGPEGRLYRQAIESGNATPITPTFGHAAAPRVSPDGRWVVYVHSYEGNDVLALVDNEGQLWPRKLAFGTDFVMQPAWHPDGKYLAYVVWNHPQMPWDGTELRLAALEYDGAGVLQVAAIESLIGDETTAIFQPEFSPDGRYLSYISDATGWGQLYLYDMEAQTHTAITSGNAEHGTPAWTQGQRTYGWTPDSMGLVYLRNERGFYSLWRYDMQKQLPERLEALDIYTYLGQPAIATTGTLAVIASSTQIPARIVTYEFGEEPVLSVTSEPEAAPNSQVVVETPAKEVVRKRSTTENVAQGDLARAQAMVWPGHDREPVHGLFYAPTSERYEGAGAPPLIVVVHGGPTSQVRAVYSGETQFFASRGFAVLQVNYRGSTGYGKTYMNKLRGNWGIYDVEDSASGAMYLAEQGLADASRQVIMGGSAGGFTVLQSLIDKPGYYKAGVCAFGVANQFLLAQETHKFEERYSDSLLGPLPDAAALYRERSPIFHAEKIQDPIVLFHGEDDKVVPKNQSDAIVAVLQRRGVPHEYHTYPGEGHGWRKPVTIEAYYNAVLKFLMQYVVYG